MNNDQFFEVLTLSDIEAFPKDEREETLHLEFKTVTRFDLSSKDDKYNFARALSGFANSDGGVIVWGVDARKKDNVDCAVGLKPIPSVSGLVTRLNELTGEAILPRIDLIRHRALVKTDGSGFALTLVPASDTGPHMAKLGVDRYYKRSGTSFYRMEHFDIADMFGRRRRPQLSVTTKVAPRDAGGAKIILGLKNTGRGPARAPYFALNVSPPFQHDGYGVDGKGKEGMAKLPSANAEFPYRYGGDANLVIHPGVTHDVAAVWVRTVKHLSEKDIIINYMLCADDHPLNQDTVAVSSNNFDLFS